MSAAGNGHRKVQLDPELFDMHIMDPMLWKNHTGEFVVVAQLYCHAI